MSDFNGLNKIRSLASELGVKDFKFDSADTVISKIEKRKAEVEKEISHLQNLLNHPNFGVIEQFKAHEAEKAANPQGFDEKLKYNYYTTKLPYARKSEDEKAHKAYIGDSARLHNEFIDDLLKYHGVADHPKAQVVFHKAWDEGHSSGYNEVALVFEDLLDLVK